MKNWLKKVLPNNVFAFLRDVFYPEKIHVIEERLNSFFVTQYAKISSPALSQKVAFRNAEFKVYSKHGNDGIIAYIFSKIGVASHTFVEMGIEDGRECNTTNLARNFGWNGLMIDANEKWVESAKDFFKDFKVKVVHSFVTAENINSTIENGGISGEIDLLSIDIDSNDYWVWEAINVVKPRVLVMEYNSSFGLESVSIKYNPKFSFHDHHKKYPLYFGVSLKGLAKLSEKKGYTLVACDSHGHDAFFVRNDLISGAFYPLSSEEAFYPNPFTLKKFGSLEEQWQQIKHLDLVEI